jgi:hypothetical protein
MLDFCEQLNQANKQDGGGGTHKAPWKKRKPLFPNPRASKTDASKAISVWMAD